MLEITPLESFRYHIDDTSRLAEEGGEEEKNEKLNGY